MNAFIPGTNGQQFIVQPSPGQMVATQQQGITYMTAPQQSGQVTITQGGIVSLHTSH